MIAHHSAVLAGIDAYMADGGRRISYYPLAAPTQSPPPPPAFILGTLPGYLSADLFGETAMPGLGCYTIPDAHILADGIVVHDGLALHGRCFNHPDYYVQAALQRPPLPVRRVNARAAIIHGPGHTIYGHWLVDFLPRLHVLTQAGHDITTLPFIVPKTMPAFAAALLAAIGIPPENLIVHDETSEVLHVREVLMPTIMRLSSRLHERFADATRFWVARACAGAAVPTGRHTHLFVSRRFAHASRALDNRAEIEAIARAEGFVTVIPENLPFLEQVSLFSGARVIAGEYGSGLHNCLFAPPGTVVCALRGTSHHPLFIQSGIGEAFSQHTGYVFGETDEHAVDQVFRIDPAHFKRALEISALIAKRSAHA